MAIHARSTTAPTRPLLPFVHRTSAPSADPRSAVEILDEIRREVDRQEIEAAPELPPEPLISADVPLAGKCWLMSTDDLSRGDITMPLARLDTAPARATVAQTSEPLLPPPAPLPSLTTAFSRRRAIFGAFALAAAPVAVLPAMAAPAAVDADADLIEFAGRVAALERRCYAFSEQRSTITDQVTSTLGFGPKAPPKPPSVSGVEKIEDYQTATHRVMSISYALVEDPAVAEWEASHKAARATYKNECKALEERLGLPELDRNFDRNWRRLHRWYAQLADMHPQTLAGLAAKAEPLVMISEASSCAGSWGEVDDYAHDLALSLAHDAMRLGRGGARV